jgi:UDP-N-acetylmuramate dehydrogenase
MATKPTLSALLPGLEENFALAPETYFHLGGPARYFWRAKTKADFLVALKAAQALKMPVLVLGSASNVAISDKGFKGLVIKLENLKPSRSACQLLGETLVCEANIPLAYLVDFSLRRGLAGLEALSGIPGTVGGAIVGNAGAYGRSISDSLVWIEIYDGKKVRRLTKAQGHFKYRHSLFKERRDYLVLAVAFKLESGDRRHLLAEAKRIKTIRAGKYPDGLYCAGSFFKNVLLKNLPAQTKALIPQAKIIEGKVPAGFLLDSSGAADQKQGGMEVATFHRNFLINTGLGTFADLQILAKRLKTLVRRRFGIELEEEIRYIT